jgi:hypothetical protein
VKLELILEQEERCRRNGQEAAPSSKTGTKERKRERNPQHWRSKNTPERLDFLQSRENKQCEAAC